MSRLVLQRRLTLFGTLYDGYDQNRASLTQMFVFNVARQRFDLDHMFCMKSHGHTCNQKLNLLTCKNIFRLPHDAEAAPHLPRVVPPDRGGDHHRVPPWIGLPFKIKYVNVLVLFRYLKNRGDIFLFLF